MHISTQTWIQHVGAIILFLVLSIVYFYPAFTEGKVIHQSDNIKASGMGGSHMEKYEETAQPGEFSVWSDAMFSGMPYIAKYGEAAPRLPGIKEIDKVVKTIGYTHASMLLIGLICFYILMCVMGVNWWLAIAGSIAFAFASYNMIIIEVGHIVKAYVIGYMPLTLAGMALLFRKKYLWGIILFTLGIGFSISNGHIQITYYLFLLCIFIYLAYFVTCLQTKQYTEIGKVTAIMAGCIVLAVLPNTKKLYADWDLGRQSTRGGTELTTTSSEGEKISSGLDKEYAFQWSYGKGELLTLLIPNAYGGPSAGYLDNTSELYKELRAKGAQVGNEVQTYTYWGDKISTSGPVYFGSIVCFLFLLGMIVIKSPMKWWLFAGSLFLTFLALGRNFDSFNTIMFHYLPMYNKFRTVEMALVIPGLVFPIIGIWGLNEIFSGKIENRRVVHSILISLGVTGGICLIIWGMPSLFLNFRSTYDSYYQLPDWYYNALLMDRATLASSDALRSLIFILLASGLLVWYNKTSNKIKAIQIVSAALAILILIDLWGVDKRYLNEKNFVKEKAHEVYKETVADKEIFKDTDPSFRVLNLNNPFQETSTSYFHKSVGGYHAAKLRRYQELIDHRLSAEISNIIRSLQEAQTPQDLYGAFANSSSLNMLNTRYIIYNPEQPPLRNPFAFGNAWFVDRVEIVENADAEIAALNSLNPLTTAVVDKRFADELKGYIPYKDSTATIQLESYRPNKLIYSSNSLNEQVAVFSEIYYYPGWRATIDGKPVSHFRADWILRAMRIPAGEHTIVFEFYPEGYITAAYIESFSSFFLLLLLIGVIAYSVWTAKNKNKTQIEK
ncbi:MAG: YfhO family protein [Tannerellaceae bacterium]|nr:YfhO family protein [Tannerellaceae bacterium]